MDVDDSWGLCVDTDLLLTISLSSLNNVLSLAGCCRATVLKCV